MSDIPAPANDIRIDALISADPLRWNFDKPYGTPIVLTFSFPRTPPAYVVGDDLEGWRPFSDFEISVTRQILFELSLLVAIDFVEATTEVGQITFANNFMQSFMDGGYAGYAYLPNSTNSPNDGDVYMNHTETERIGDGAFLPGGRQLSTLVHEIGHALGLKHPNDYQPNEPQEAKTDVPPFLPLELDTSVNTVMTYNDPPLGNQRIDFGPFDILALQFLYGARAVRTGDDLYPLTDDMGGVFKVIHDNGGNDTIDASALSTGVTIDLRPGAAFGVGVAPSGARNTENVQIMLPNPRFGLETLIENVVGTRFDDVLVGNRADNRITLGTGNDNVDGREGIDTVVITGARGNSSVVRDASVVGQWSLSVSADTKSLVSVERVRFDDGLLALDIELGLEFSNAGAAYRLYQAAFARTPDKGGLSFWISMLDKGMSQRDAAQGFIGSAEFAGIYGQSPTDAALVDGFYQNILGRAAEEGGRNFWLGVLERGPEARAEVLAGIANSAENQDRLLPTIGQGIWIPLEFLAA